MSKVEPKERIGVIREWCEAQRQWDWEIHDKGRPPPNSGAGYPRMVTRARLYFAGRALYGLAGVEPDEDSLYAKNRYNERPDVLELLSEELDRRKPHGREAK